MGMDPYETIWITGASGRMGRTLTSFLSHRKFTVFSTDREINIAELDTVTDFASRNRPAIVINCAGISRKDQAEENFVRELNPRHIIVRSSWVYTDIPEDPIMRAIADAKRGIRVQPASNQFSSPTSAWSLVRLIGVILRHHEYGVFHATSQGTCSHVEFLEKVFEKCGLDTSLIDPVESNHPYHIELDNLMLKMTELFTFPNWEEDLQQFIDISGLKA